MSTPIDVVHQDALLLLGRQPPIAAWRPERVPCGASPARLHVPVAVPVQQVLVRPEQKRAGPAGGVENPSVWRSVSASCPRIRADGVLDDVVDDVGRRVIDAAGFLDLRLLLDLGLVTGREPDDLAEKLLVDLAENVGRQDGKFVGTLGVVEAADDVLEGLVVDRQPGREFVGRSARSFSGLEMKEAGVVAIVGLVEEIPQPLVDVLPFSSAWKLAVRLDAAIFADAQEDNAVDGELDGVIQLAVAELGIAQARFLASSSRQLSISSRKAASTWRCRASDLVIRRTCRRSLCRTASLEKMAAISSHRSVLPIGEIEDAAGAGLVARLGRIRQS